MKTTNKPPSRDQLALDKLTRARANMIIEQPFFGALALRLKLEEDSSIPTLAVNGKVIRYNPAFIRSLEPTLVKSAVCHEVGHCIFSHIHRRGDRDPLKWNHAGDYVINAMLKDSGFSLGKGWLFNDAFKDMTADHIYSLLPPGQGKAPGSPDGPLCEIEQASNDEATTAEDERDWKVATIQAANAAQVQGRLPGNLKRFVDGMFDAQVDWRTILRRFVTQVNEADYSWARPNRRMLGHGFYLPKLWGEQMGELAICVDTSGSIDGPTLAAFEAEIAAIVVDTRPELTHVIYCDASINRVDTFGRDDPIKLEAVGGGGTSFLPPFEYLEEHGIEPVCLVYLTDLYGPHGPEPMYPTLWCCTTKQVAPWGETVPLEL